MRKKLSVVPFLLFVCFAFFSCKKDEGKGGLATIQGKVYAYEYDKYFISKIDSGYLADERVYISYGNHTAVDDDVRSSYDGSFKFDYLQKGNYTVFCYSRCDTCPLGTEVTKSVVTITSTKQVLNMPDFLIKK